jgi:predicted dehydrogenase
MAREEGKRADKIDFVSIVTPNHLHYPIAKVFLQNDIHVICDKPLAMNVCEAEELANLAAKRNLLFGITYTYTGYPMAMQAREMVSHGDIGGIRYVAAEYSADWLLKFLQTGEKESLWRLNPALSGPTNCLADTGSHMENMVSFMTGLKIKRLLAKLDAVGDGIQMDTNDTIMVEYTNGASGMYWCSQIAIGYENSLRVRIFGEKGTLEWSQETPDYLHVAMLGQPKQIYTKSNRYLYPSAQALCRVPDVYPEGYYAAFANLYTAFAYALIKRKQGKTIQPGFPTVQDGLQSMKVIDKCIESASNGSSWVDY